MDFPTQYLSGNVLKMGSFYVPKLLGHIVFEMNLNCVHSISHILLEVGIPNIWYVDTPWDCGVSHTVSGSL